VIGKLSQGTELTFELEGFSFLKTL